ncbi:unnamed protein product [Rotaria sp. Silwood1]|nr:unnamed protein product [Rotaria sp. Silwood1]CAF1356006.1 unnamed protein product [Rotaria sp. Silwood1]CAF3514674.1 unnamed protein product [Rotaria sp. Silwood1]CAF4692407.1 unnamed protein product [Rotaria sp. Silwood1]CAF4719183.1 unnamed protein product [Rotaria sp. Silwood1]
MQSLGVNDDSNDVRDTATNISSSITPKSSHSLFAKLTDAKKTLFGRTNVPDPFFSSATQNKSLLTYILSEPNPQLDIIQEFERNGSQLNSITDEGNSILHLLARAEMHSMECIQIVDYLTKKGGCDPNKQNDYGWTAAHYALATHNTDLALFLFKVMTDINVSTFEPHFDYPSQTYLLHIAARKNDSLCLRLLIKTYKARVNVFDEDGCTPLHISCYEDNIDALKALLENDADFQKGTRLNPFETPICICVKYQHDSCLQALFDLTSNFNWKRYFSQLPRSPLLCDFPSIYAIELLVQYSLDINACDEQGNTFIHYLVNKKDIDYEKYIEKLIETSADFNRQNQLGHTPFLDALEQNNFQLLAVFLRHIDITNINIVDKLLNTALHYCKYLNEKFIFDSVLTSNPLSLNAQNRDGQTPLHDAILYDNYLFAQYLLQHSCDVTLTNKDGNTPLHLIAKDDNVRMCKLLMKYTQLDLTATNRMGKTPLHLACANEKANVAAIFINKMNIEQINLIDIQGRTPLHECVDNMNGVLARYLIRHGADENAKDVRGNTVLHLAAEKGNIELIRTLIKSSNVDINQVNIDGQSPLSLGILYNHDEVCKVLLDQEKIHVQSIDLKMTMQMNNYEIVRLLIEKDPNCLRVRSSKHGDMIIHTYMRLNLNNSICLETLLSYISDNELLAYLSESSLTFGDNLLHIAAREDTPNALNSFLNISRVKFWFWANMMLTKNNENKTPLELANEFKHYSVIKLINSKWKESYEHLSHSLRDGHCGVSPTGVTQAKRQCFNCQQKGFVEIPSTKSYRPCEKCNVCLYKSLDNSMQVFLALLFSDESSTIALDIMDSLIVINEVQKVVHLYLDHIEPWEEFDIIDLDDSPSLIHEIVIASDLRKSRVKAHSKDKSLTTPLITNNPQLSASPTVTNKTTASSQNINTTGSSVLTVPTYAPRPSITQKFRPDGTQFRSITPLEAIYYHERLDLITHPLIKGLIKWKWDNFAAKRFYIGLALQVLFLIAWTCTSLITPFPIRYVYRFPQDIWRCILWATSIGFLIWEIVQEMFDISYSRQRYEDYLLWESERTNLRLDLISKDAYQSNTSGQLPQSGVKKMDYVAKINNDSGEVEHVIVDDATTNIAINPPLPTIRSHHSQHYPLPPSIPTIIKGKPIESQPIQQTPIDVIFNSSDPPTNLDSSVKKKMGFDTSFISPPMLHRRRSQLVQFARNFRDRAKTRIRAYYMYYSLNNLFDWIVYILCVITVITHCIDVNAHTVLRARIHMYIASITVICIWFRFMVFFRTITISAKTLRSKLVEIKLGELVIMVRLMFDDIIRFLMVFIFLLAPYAFVFYAVFGGPQVMHNDYEKSPEICEHALLHCSIYELQIPYDGSSDSDRSRGQFIFNSSLSDFDETKCLNATSTCRLVQPNGFDTFSSLLFSIFRIALVDDIPIDAFTAIDRYFASFVCTTYLLFTAILAVNIFIGLISNALQTEAFSTVEARFLLERIEVILNYEWRLSKRKRSQIQELIHRDCSPLQLHWKDINFDAYGQSREEQQSKALTSFRQTIDKQNIQFDTFRIQLLQKLNNIDTTLNKIQSTSKPLLSTEKIVKESKTNTPVPSRRPSIHVTNAEQSIIAQQELMSLTPNNQTLLFEEITRLRELIEEKLAGQTDRVSAGSGSSSIPARQSTVHISPRQQFHVDKHVPLPVHTESHIQAYSQDLGERVTDLQLAVNRLHQDVSAIRQVIERMSPLSTSLILGRTAGLK